MSRKHRTGVLLRATELVTGGGFAPVDPYVRVKLDGQGFPYVIIGHQQFRIASAVFPQELSVFGDKWGSLDGVIEGAEELDRILANPNLTVDKLSAGQLARVSA